MYVCMYVCMYETPTWVLVVVPSSPFLGLMSIGLLLCRGVVAVGLLASPELLIAVLRSSGLGNAGVLGRIYGQIFTR